MTLADLAVIPGSLPDLRGVLPFCRYRDRCERRQEDCDAGPVPVETVGLDHAVRCRHHV